MKLNKKNKVICIIQARVNSTRLPKKVLKEFVWKDMHTESYRKSKKKHIA